MNPKDRPPDLEYRLTDEHHESLRLWMRLLTCTTMIERGVRRRLRDRFDLTLARFDLMAQLERSPGGLKMGELSRRLMVTGGNVPGLVDQLAAEGLVERRAVATDRRVQAVHLTPAGRERFAEMAAEHERWIVELVAGLSPDDRRALHALLGKLKASVARHEPGAGPEGTGG